MKKNAEQIGIWGCKGSGKTTRQLELIEGRKRVIFLDPMNTISIKGYKRCSTIRNALVEIKNGWNTGFHIIVPTGHREDQCLDFMRAFIPALFKVQSPYYASKRGMAGREITLVIDEAHKFFPNRKFSPAEQEHIEDIIALGRHYGIEIIAASQRLAKVWTEYRGNCTQHYFFAQGDHSDIEATLKIIGTSQRENLMGLMQHEYMHKSREAGATISKGRNKARF
jgi:hypothetical protein